MGKGLHSGKPLTDESRLALKEALHSHTRYECRRLIEAVSIETQSEDERVITADVNRSVSSWDIHRCIRRSERNAKRKKLGQLIKTLARSLRGFRYYQGLHDVCLVFLELASGSSNECLAMLIPFIRTHFWDFIVTDFDQGLLPVVDRVRFIIESEDPELHLKLQDSGVGYFITVPWILTWFAHSLHSYRSICDMYNFLIRHDGKNTIVHVSASVLLQSRDRLLEDNVSHDVVNELNLEKVFRHTIQLHKKYSSSGLIKLRMHISRRLRSPVVLTSLLIILVALFIASSGFNIETVTVILP
jgi:hypothetical protein